jgi:tetratricopeptide (TPR) repeat protein
MANTIRTHHPLSPLAVVIILLLTGSALYFFSLQAPFFHYDDKVSIAANPAIQTLDLPKIFNTFNTRLLGGLSFALNYQLAGLYPPGYRLFNLLLHIFNAWLVFRLAGSLLRLLNLCKPLTDQRITEASLFAALLFLCHPIQTEPVNFITQRFVLLASTFYLGAIILYLRSRTEHLPYGLVGSLACTLAAMFCKEFVITLPFTLALTEFFFLNHLGENVVRRTLRLLPFLATALIIPMLLLRTPNNPVPVAQIANINIAKNGETAKPHVDIFKARNSISRKDYFLTELNVVRDYVRLMVWPAKQNIDPDFPISNSINATTFFSGLFLSGLLLLALTLYVKHRITAYGILWFFAVLSVESSIIPIGHVMAEYRLYLPTAGFALVLMCFVYLKVSSVLFPRVIALAILLGLSTLTLARNHIWADECRLWGDTLEKSPNKPRAYINLAGALINRKKYAEAADTALRGIQISPLPELYANLAEARLGQAEYELAIAAAEEESRLAPDSGIPYRRICVAHAKQNQLDQALFFCRKAEALNPPNPLDKQLVGNILLMQKKFPDGLKAYADALKLAPNISNAMEFSKALIFFYKDSADKASALRYLVVLEENGFPREALALQRLIETD